MKKRFNRVHVEISNICNVQCSFCPVVERPKDIMSLEEYKKVLNQVVPLTNDICLHLMGEPLAHPQFRDILKLTSQAEGKVQITTNGLLIKRYSELLLSESCTRQVNFSLQAFKDNFPNRPLGEYLVPIIDFIKKAFEQRPDLYINLRLWNFGDQSFSLNEDVLSCVEELLGIETLKREIDVSSIKSKKVFPNKRLYFHFDSRFDWPSPHFPKRSEVGTCHGLGNHIGIHADGTVVPCCLDKEAIIKLGNIFDEDLKTVLNNERSCAMKKGFDNYQLIEDLCQKCTYIQRFDSKVPSK